MTEPRPQGPRNVWIDGRIEPADGRHLSVFDRGFQLGDGVFETLRARGGTVAEIDEHLARLRASADGLGIELAGDAEDRLREGIANLLSAEGLGAPEGDAAVRITVTRGEIRARGLLPPPGTRSTMTVQVSAVVPPDPALIERGLHVIASDVRRDPESPIVGLKTTSRAEYVYARLEAQRLGADDALFLTLDGHLSEATSANLFLVRGDELATPALACAILPGTTRSWILSWGSSAGLRIHEGWLTTRHLAEADEAFLSSSVAGILPVTRFGGESIGTGRPGPWTVRARDAREAWIRALPAPTS